MQVHGKFAVSGEIYTSEFKQVCGRLRRPNSRISYRLRSARESRSIAGDAMFNRGIIIPKLLGSAGQPVNAITPDYSNTPKTPMGISCGAATGRDAQTPDL